MRIDDLSRRLGTLAATLACLATVASAAELRGYRADFATPATLERVDPATGAASVPDEHASCPSATPNTVFSVGFLGGLEVLGEEAFATELSGSSSFLVRLPRQGCAIGARVGADAVGFPNLEGLAACDDGALYSASFVFASHQGQLVRIDRATGLGTAVGLSLPLDVRVTGLACDPGDDLLWAATSGFASRASELWRINPSTGATTLVGALGVAANTIEGLALAGGRLYGSGTKLHEIDIDTGAATLLGGDWAGTLWGLAGLPEPCLPASPDGDGDGTPDCADACPVDPAKAAPGACGCGAVEDASDGDGDGVVACLDNCPSAANASQLDSDGDRAGDACDACIAFWTPRDDADLPCLGRWADLAPAGARDGQLSVADLVQLLMFVGGGAVPDDEQRARADVAPAAGGPGSPPVAQPLLAQPRTLDGADVDLLLDAVLERVELAAPA